MKYLARAVRRLATPTAPAVRPAMPSRSPVAEADQRYHLDSFAAHFGAPIASTGIAGPPDEGEVLGDPDRPDERDRPRERPPSPPAVVPAPGAARAVGQADAAAPRIPGAEPRRRVASAGPGRGPSLEPSAGPSPDPTAGPVRRLADADRRGSPSPPGPDRAVAPTDRRLSARAARPEDEPTRPSSAGRGRPAPDRGRGQPEGWSGEGHSSGDHPTDALTDALTRAMAWVQGRSRSPESGRRERGPGEPRTPAGEGPPPPGRAAMARPARVAVRDSRPVTHLEIGKIEVEVVPPAKPARYATPPAPGSSVGVLGGSPAPKFGWRQR